MKSLPWVNFIGVFCLAGLCLAQWRRDRDLNHEVNRLQREAFAQAARLEQEAGSSRGLSADVQQIKARYDTAAAERDRLGKRLRELERDLKQLTAERDRLSLSLSNWTAAVSLRDQRLKEAAAQIQRLGEELTTSVGRYNTLASNQNRVVKELQELRLRSFPNPSQGALPGTASAPGTR